MADRHLSVRANTKRVGLLSLLGLLAIACATKSPPEDDDSTLPRTDRSWVRVDGKIVATSDNAFELDYGQGLITVEMDDWDWYPEGRQLLPEDRVIVRGRIDNDFYQQRSIEASSVYVEGLGTHFYASSADEEALPVPDIPLIRPGVFGVTGVVKSKEGREFVLQTGRRGDIRVDTSALGYNPLDDEGYQRINTGDRVHVVGHLSRRLFEDRRLVAESVATVRVDSASGA